MGFDLSALNAKYRNLSEIAYSENAWRLVRVDDAVAETAYKALLKCWQERFLGDDHFEDLRSALRDAYVALRSAVGTASNMNEYLTQIKNGVEASAKKVDNFLSPNERNLLTEATLAFSAYANQSDYPLVNAALREAAGSRHEVSLVVSGSEFAVIASDLDSGLTVYPSITRALSNLHFKKQNHVLVIAAPDAYMPIHQVRLLLLGGDTVKVTFIVPNWWSTSAASYLNSQIWFGLDGPDAQYIKEIGKSNLTTVPALPTSNINWDFSVPAKPLSKQVEKYINEGPIECNLLLLNQGLVMPLEKDASRIAVIRQANNEYGFELDFEAPKTAAENHEVVFSFSQVSHRSFIKEQADKYLGDDLVSIEEIQDSWKTRLNSEGLRLGWAKLAEQLAAVGVDKAHRVRWWAQDPTFIRPMSENDFQQLLVFLDFQGKFISEAFEATRRINYARDTAGTVARKALASAVTDQIWANIQSGTPSEINLNDVGEASFIASKIEAIQKEPIFAGILQVRRILGGN